MTKLMNITTIAVTTAVAALMSSGPLVRAAEDDTGKAKTEQTGQLARKDYKFVRDAAQGGLLEVKLGELAKQKGTSPTVQKFGDQMVADHSKANDELKQIASQKGVTLPSELTRREQSEVEHLQKLNGKDFDKAYATRMVKDHQKDIKEFERAAKDCQDSDVKAFAQKTLPTLEHHAQMAQQMESSIKQQEVSPTGR